MKRALSCAAVACIASIMCMALSGCDEPCKPGYAKKGWDCKKLPVDGGLDGGDGQNANGSMDGGLGECLPPACDPCDAKPCENGGACETTARGFACTCAIGFSGARCQIDPCELDACLHGGVCKRSKGGRTCSCSADWTGDSCEINTNPSLGDLTVSGGTLTPKFDANGTSYVLELGFETSAISFTAHAAVPAGVRMEVNGEALRSGEPTRDYPLEISPASQPFRVLVTTNGDVTREYEVLVRRSVTRQARIASPFAQAGANFGAAMASNGPQLAVAAPNFDYQIGTPSEALDAGAVTIYRRKAFAFEEAGTIYAGSRAGAHYGSSLAMDARWLFISVADEVDVYEYSVGFDSWSRRGTLRSPNVAELGFGNRVALGSGLLAVGAHSDSEPKQDDRVYLFVTDDTAPAGWRFSSALQGASGSSEDAYGKFLTVDPSGNWVAVTGSDPMRVDSWHREGATWAKETIQPPDSLSAHFGTALAMQGERLIVGDGEFCLLDLCTGASRILEYVRRDGAWVESNRFERPMFPDVPQGEVVNSFGLQTILAGPTWLLADGFTGVMSGLGGPYGVGHLFDTSGGTHVHRFHVVAYDGAAPRSFVSVSASVAGGRLLVGAPDDAAGSLLGTGAIYVFGADCSGATQGASPPGC